MSLIPRGSFFDVDKFFDDFWSPATQRGSNVGAFFTPRVDIKEHDGHYEISAELPGVAHQDKGVDPCQVLGVVAAVAPDLGPATLAVCAGVLEAGVGVPAAGTAVIVALEKV